MKILIIVPVVCRFPAPYGSTERKFVAELGTSCVDSISVKDIFEESGGRGNRGTIRYLLRSGFI